jgi:hypothetical protein|tara:strand:+ start:1528 stop:2007 length:480 start_codon:yes stop_codon:yes gene_type:complete
MAIPRKQIGWGTDLNLLWGIWKALDGLTRVVSKNKPVEPTPVVAPTYLPFRLISAASTNETVVKASAGQLTTITAVSLNDAAVSYLKLYDKATAPVLATDIPVMTIPIPTNAQGAGIVIPISNGLSFSNGISLAVTAGIEDTNAIAILANEVVLNFTYA